MNYRPLALLLGGAALGYIAWTQRNAQPLDELRNRGMRFRPVGGPAEDYPEWVRALKGKSGVYVIRELDENGEPVIVYVGESHTDRLYDTLTRHLQQWRRWKGFWKGQYGQGHDPGLTYDRDGVDVAVRVVPPEEAIDLEARLIRKLVPRDNINGQVIDLVEEDPPF